MLLRRKVYIFPIDLQMFRYKPIIFLEKKLAESIARMKKVRTFASAFERESS